MPSMSGSFEKSVKGATKIKAAPPKTKYIEHILVATHSGEAGVGEVFRALQYRLRDSTWTVVLKGLITVHLMIREGRPDVTLTYLAKHPSVLGLSPFSDAQTQGRNIRHYSRYLSERSRAFKDTKIDWVRAKESRLENLSVEKGLLRETEAVQNQLTALLACDVMEEDPENEITITVFRLLVLDLLALFQVLNQGLISILGHFFEMSKPDAERAMSIYRKFTKQTDHVVQYLSVARQFEHHTRVGVPKLKHAPVHLGKQLEEYLRDPDFETHRRQYLAELDAKKKAGRSGTSPGILRLKSEKSGNAPAKPAVSSSTNGTQAESKPAQPVKAPDHDLIDFFGSIEQNQTPMNVQTPTQQQFVNNTPFQQAQPTGFAGNGMMAQPTGTNPFQQMQQQQQIQQQQMQIPQQPQQMQPQQLQQSYTGYPQQQPQPLQQNFTGAGFGGFTPQPSFQPGNLGTIQQDAVSSYPTGATGQSLGAPQTTNPFRASMMLGQQPTGQPSTLSAPAGSNPNRLSTNPFAQQQVASQPTGSPFPQQQQQPAPLQPMPTGTNPFAKTSPPPQGSPAGTSMPASLAPQPTGATNPFRQSTFVNHNTGMGWQHSQMPMGGGLDQAPTIPVFPRPAQQAPWQQ